MGFAEKMRERGRRAVVELLEKEAAKAGCSRRAETRIVSLRGITEPAGVWRELAATLIGGRLAPEEVLIFQMKKEGLNLWYFHPCAKLTALPGEHHALLPGVVPASAWLQAGDGS